MKLNDSDPLPSSLKLHGGKPLIEVPADYLLWLADQPWCKQKYPDVYAYIEENRTVLDAEQKDEYGYDD